MMEWFLAASALILAGGLIAEALPDRLKAGALTLCIGLALVPLVWLALSVLIAGGSLDLVVRLGSLLGEVVLRLDPLAAFFVLLTSLGGFAASLFAVGYVRHYLAEKRHFAFHFFFMALLLVSMLLLFVVQNALAFLIVWELMSLSSFMLVVFENETAEVLAAGINYLIAMHIGVVFLIAGFAWLSVGANGLDFAGFRAVLERDGRFRDLVFLLFLVGFGTKAGLVPFHSWLPKAHPAAPGHVSALMSGVMIKTGLYGIMRFFTWCASPSLTMALALLALGAISALTGIAYALHERDLKRLLAWSSIENIGLISLCLGLACLGRVMENPAMAVLATAAACLHLLNHALFKMLLFFGAAQVASQTHTRNLESLGGLARFLPVTAGFFLVGSLAICALPPLNGFASEFLMYFALLQGVGGTSVTLHATGIAGIGFLALIGAMVLIAFTRAYSIVFSGLPRTVLPDHLQESPVSLVAMGSLALPILAIGLFPLATLGLLAGVVGQVSGFGAEPDGVATIGSLIPGQAAASLGKIGMVGAGLVLGTAALLLIRHLLVRRPSAGSRVYKTWDCGYQTVSPKVQYTASSYASIFLNLARPFVRVRRQLHKPQGEFPVQASFSSQNSDRFEDWLIRPVIGVLLRFLGLFSVLQSRNVKQYLIYAISFIIIIVAAVVGVPR